MAHPKSLGLRLAFAVGGLSVLLILCLMLALWTGAVDVSPSQILREIWEHLMGRSAGQTSVIWELRLPRVLLAALVGAILAAGGAALQGLLGNPLAEPYTVGVSSGCVLGASVAVTFGLDGVLGGWGVPLLAFGTGACSVLLVFSFARRSGQLDVNTFLLAGIIVGSMFWAITTFILSANREDLARIFMWLTGSFGKEYPWLYLSMTFQAAIITFLGLIWFARDLNAYALGEDSARQLGVEPERLKSWIIGLVTLATAVSVSAAGVIGFVGLIVPHGMRRLFGADHRLLITASALAGACLMALADGLARGLVPPREIPVGVITAALGAPVFLLILRRSGT